MNAQELTEMLQHSIFNKGLQYECSRAHRDAAAFDIY